MGVLWVFQGWFKDVLWDFRGALREFYGFILKGVKRCFKGALGVFQGIVSTLFQGYLKDVLWVK